MDVVRFTNLRRDDGMSLHYVGGLFVKFVGSDSGYCGSGNVPTLSDFVEVGSVLCACGVVCNSLYNDWLEVEICGKVCERFL